MGTGTERPESGFVRRALRGTRFAHVRWVEQTGSTNDDLAAAAKAGEPEQVLITDLQTAGRGRRDRVWTAPTGSSVLMSLLVRDVAPPDAFWAVGAVALAAVEATAEVAGVECHLKWPNDLVIGDDKVAGILAQIVEDAAIIGIGINVNWPFGAPALAAPDSDGPKPTALSHHRPDMEPVDRAALAVAIIARTVTWLDAERDVLRAGWRSRCATIGRTVRVDLAAGSVVGQAVDVADNGALVVEHDGSRAAYEVGDVVHLRSG